MAIPRGRALRAVEAAQAAQAAQSAEAAQASSSSSADRRGELQFTATFEGGNLGSVTKVSELEYELSLRPDSNNPKYRLWCAQQRIRASTRPVPSGHLKPSPPRRATQPERACTPPAAFFTGWP